MLSAVSMAFSSAHVTRTEKIVTARRARCQTLPVEVSRPMQNCAYRTDSSCFLNSGTNRSVMLSTNASDGIARPNRYTNLSAVIT